MLKYLWYTLAVIVVAFLMVSPLAPFVGAGLIVYGVMALRQYRSERPSSK